MIWILSATLLALIATVSTIQAQPTSATRDILTGLDTPWEVLWGSDGHIWYTERPGRVGRVDPASGEHTTILDIDDLLENNGSESGLLGMALDPAFPDSPYVYLVSFRDNAGSVVGRLDRYRWDGSTLRDRRALLDSIPGGFSGLGGRLLALPDRTLILSVGDGTIGTNAQDGSTLAGKVLRIGTDGTIPNNNPWTEAPWPRSLIYSMGHRNIQGFVQNSRGDLIASEHGSTSNDEINIVESGRNYGWPVVQGLCDIEPEQRFCNDSQVVEPIHSWRQSMAPTGIDYYRGTGWNGGQPTILVAALKSHPLNIGALHLLTLDSNERRVVADTALYRGVFGRLRDVCVAPDGRIFLATSNRDGRADTSHGFPRKEDDRIVEISPPVVSSVPPSPPGLHRLDLRHHQ